jgi:hypothetical protein
MRKKEMKRKITLSIALALSIILVSLTGSDSNVGAQNQTRFAADTGMITLGPNQTLRVAIKSPRDSASGQATGFKRIEYAQQGVCSGGVCKHEISSQTASGPVTLAPNEALTVDLEWSANVSGSRIVVSSGRDLQVNAMIIDAATGKVVSIFQALTTNENF